MVLTSQGKPLGTIATGVNTANCAFGEDGMTLFVACDHDIARIRLSTKGKGFYCPHKLPDGSWCKGR